jgi:hypothetical protein
MGFVFVWIAIFGLIVAFFCIVRALAILAAAVEDHTRAIKAHMICEHGFKFPDKERQS